MKCHGASNEKAIENALLKTQKSIDTNLIPDIKNIVKNETEKNIANG